MYAVSLLLALSIIAVQKAPAYLQEDEYDYNDAGYDNPLNCSITETIRGGHVTYSQGGLQGSVLTYHCEPGHYPSPVSHRLCSADGEWSAMILANGRRLYQAICKAILCPGQLQLDHGEFWPRDQWFRPGEVQSFSCQEEEGVTLVGSAQRNCTLSGHWTGSTPICETPADDCKDPGVPPGAQRSGDWLRIGEELRYQCQSGLDLLGSAVRVCLENREWSGSAPRCQAPNTFDSLSVVAEAMSGSLSGVMDVLSPDSKQRQDVSFARTMMVTEDSRLNIFILLDTSASITADAFVMARNATIELIKKLDSYEVQMKFHVISFASQAIDVVTITDTYISSNADHVIMTLKNFDDKAAHGSRRGTNLYSALERVNDMIALFKQNSKEHHFNETQNIIIIETDGYSNTGGNVLTALAKIRSHLGYNPTGQDHTDETLLDVYVFGVGTNINKKVLNTIASKKPGEKHMFTIKNYNILGEIFNMMISDKSVTKCGVAQEEDSSEKAFTNPWHVRLLTGKKSGCHGSIVSQNWVLTAAHCFTKKKIESDVMVKHGAGHAFSKKVIMHPMYNLRALQHRNVSEFYDYDVALIELNTSIPLSWKARPICLPCTIAGSRAMKKVNSTCKQHREELLPHKQTAASFIHKAGSKQKETHIQTRDERQTCVEKALLTFKKPTNVTLDEYVSDRFLCSGGSKGFQDSNSCPGDSGGSLFLQTRRRYFQVGIVSWGTINVCEEYRFNEDDARDFHISLFDIVPWLKENLGHEIDFLPLDN